MSHMGFAPLEKNEIASIILNITKAMVKELNKADIKIKENIQYNGISLDILDDEDFKLLINTLSFKATLQRKSKPEYSLDYKNKNLVLEKIVTDYNNNLPNTVALF